LIINELWRVNLIGGVRNGFSHFPRDQEVWGYSRMSLRDNALLNFRTALTLAVIICGGALELKSKGD
jgi:hypothetical protein